MQIRCPTCDKVVDDVPDDFGPRPFCSRQCKLVDLGRWLDGAYAARLDAPAPDLRPQPDLDDPLNEGLVHLGLEAVPAARR